MFILTCPFCRQNLSAENEWIGQQAACPNCNQVITIIHPYKNRNFLMIPIGVSGVSILFFVLMLIGISNGWFGDIWRDSYFTIKHSLLSSNRSQNTSNGNFSSSRLVRITANGYPKYSARYEIYVNGSLSASSDETSGYWNTRMSLKNSDTIYAKVLFKNGYGAVGEIEYSYKTAVGSSSTIDLETSKYRKP